jgi:hypothetical protein
MPDSVERTSPGDDARLSWSSLERFAWLLLRLAAAAALWHGDCSREMAADGCVA